MMHNASDENTPARCCARSHCVLWFLAALVIGGGIAFFFPASPVRAKACEPTTIALGPKSEMMKVEEKGDTLTVWLRENGAAVIRRYAMCDGEILRDVRITGGTGSATPGGAPPY